MGSIKFKEERLQKFLFFLKQTYGIADVQLYIVDVDQKTRFSSKHKLIIFSKKSIKENSLESLFYILAHEFRHAQQFESLNLHKLYKDRVYYRLRNFFIGLIWFLMINFLIPHTELGHSILLWTTILSLYPFVMLFLFPLKLTRQEFDREVEADDFANKVVGGAVDVFSDESDNHKMERLIQFLTVSRTHPTMNERLLVAKDYPLNLTLISKFTK